MHYHYGREPGTNEIEVGVMGDENVVPVNFSLTGFEPKLEGKIVGFHDPSGIVLYAVPFAPKTKNEYGSGFVAEFKVLDKYKMPLENVEVKAYSFDMSDNLAPNAGDFMPEASLTDENGKARIGFVAKSAGKYKMKAFLPEFPNVPCFSVEFDVLDNYPVTMDEVNFGEYRTIFKSGNGQRGIKDKKLVKNIVLSLERIKTILNNIDVAPC